MSLNDIAMYFTNTIFLLRLCRLFSLAGLLDYYSYCLQNPCEVLSVLGTTHALPTFTCTAVN
jgi:hypothetical protein